MAYRTIAGNEYAQLAEFVSRFDAAIVGGSTKPFLNNMANVAIIQMGDLFDRGKNSYKCLKIMEVAESVIGVKVITIMGNHELMTIISSDSYEQLVHPQDDLRSYRNEFKRPEGSLWRSMVNNLMGMVQIGSPSKEFEFDDPRNPTSLFVHAGIVEDFLYAYDLVAKPAGYQYRASEILDIPKFSPGQAGTIPPRSGSPSSTISARDFNERFLYDMEHASPEYLDHKYTYAWSPFTSRNYGEIDIDCESVNRVLGIFKVSRIIVGHLPTMANELRFNCNGRIFLTDVAASRYMSGHHMDHMPPRPNIQLMHFDSSRDGSFIAMESLIYGGGSVRIDTVYDAEKNGPLYKSINIWAKNIRESYILSAPMIDEAVIGGGGGAAAVASSRSSRAVVSETHEDEESSPCKENMTENSITVSGRKRSHLDTATVLVEQSVEKRSKSSSSDTFAASSAATSGGSIIYRDHVTVIEHATVDEVDGYVITVGPSNGAFFRMEYLREELMSEDAHPGIPSIHDLPARSGNGRKFLGTDTNCLLTEYNGEITYGITSQIQSILAYMHEGNLCIGLLSTSPSHGSDLSRITAFFAIEIGSPEEKIELLNMSRLRTCDESEADDERRFFEEIFADWLDDDDYDDDEQELHEESISIPNTTNIVS